MEALQPEEFFRSFTENVFLIFTGSDPARTGEPAVGADNRHPGACGVAGRCTRRQISPEKLTQVLPEKFAVEEEESNLHRPTGCWT